MNLAVIYRSRDPLSLKLYLDNMCRELAELGVRMTFIGENDFPPEYCEILWDPAMCMRRIPRRFADIEIPIICTMHGVKAFAVDADELVTEPVERRELLSLKADLAEDWRWFRHRVKTVVAVSSFAKDEVIHAFRLPEELVTVIHHGVDKQIFHPHGDRKTNERSYFLHVSRLDPIKNLKRILKAYSAIPEIDRPDFIFIVTPEDDQPAFTNEFYHLVDKFQVVWIREPISQEELAEWYRGALALILPSLRETFGLPIIEAMSCGCPVITSNNSGCAEVASGAGIQVDPRSTEMITEAMRRIITQSELRDKLRSSGINHSDSFDWRFSAQEMVRVLRSIVPA